MVLIVPIALISIFIPFIGFLLSFVICFLYFFLLESTYEGQTLGKMLLKIRIVDEDTRKPPETQGRYAIDSLLRFPPLFFIDMIIGIIIYLFNSDLKVKIRLTQYLANTVVVLE